MLGSAVSFIMELFFWWSEPLHVTLRSNLAFPLWTMHKYSFILTENFIDFGQMSAKSLANAIASKTSWVHP